MSLALGLAQEAELAGEVPVGAVVVKDGVVLGRGRNRTIEWKDPSAHAEMLALREAAIGCGTHRMTGLELFVTLEPCAMCSGAIFHSRIARVVYGAADPKTGCAGSVLDLFAIRALNHHTQVVGGTLAHECAGLLTQFFKRSRAEKHTMTVPLREDALRTPADAMSECISPEVSSHFFYSSDGLRMHYRDLAPIAVARSVLCIHDLPYWSEQLVPLIAKLARTGYRTISPDLVGCGASDKPKKVTWHSPESHVRIIGELMAYLDVVPNHIIAIGSSLKIASVLAQEKGWEKVRVIHLRQAQDACLKSGVSAKRIPPALTRVWPGRSRIFLSGLSQPQLKVVTAPFPDAGHAAVLQTLTEDSFEGGDSEGLVSIAAPPTSNLFELESEVLDQVVSAVVHG